MYLIAEQVQGYLVKLSAIVCRTKFIICWNLAKKTSMVVEISNIVLVPSNVFFSVKHKWPRIITEFDHMYSKDPRFGKLSRLVQCITMVYFLWNTQRHIWKWYIQITQKLDPCACRYCNGEVLCIAKFTKLIATFLVYFISWRERIQTILKYMCFKILFISHVDLIKIFRANLLHFIYMCMPNKVFCKCYGVLHV